MDTLPLPPNLALLAPIPHLPLPFALVKLLGKDAYIIPAWIGVVCYRCVSRVLQKIDLPGRVIVPPLLDSRQTASSLADQYQRFRPDH